MWEWLDQSHHPHTQSPSHHHPERGAAHPQSHEELAINKLPCSTGLHYPPESQQHNHSTPAGITPSACHACQTQHAHCQSIPVLPSGPHNPHLRPIPSSNQETALHHDCLQARHCILSQLPLMLHHMLQQEPLDSHKKAPLLPQGLTPSPTNTPPQSLKLTSSLLATAMLTGEAILHPHQRSHHVDFESPDDCHSFIHQGQVKHSL